MNELEELLIESSEKNSTIIIKIQNEENLVVTIPCPDPPALQDLSDLFKELIGNMNGSKELTIEDEGNP